MSISIKHKKKLAVAIALSLMCMGVGHAAEMPTGGSLVTGTVTVPAGETVTRELSYKVSWPKDKSISETKSPGSGRICPNCGAVVHGTFCPECGSAVN